MLGPVKRMLKNVPVLGPALRRTAGLIRRQPVFLSSAQFWEDRYRTGGNSGAGSYNRLARFKADTMNEFVRRNCISSVIEFGCGDGSQLGLADYPRYIGIDVSEKAVEICRRLFGNDPSKSFLTADALPAGTTADIALSLDVIYHLVEDSVFDAYMRKLFDSAGRFAAIYSSNEDKTWPARHVRHRRFTNWIECNRPDWILRQFIKNEYPYDPNDETNTSFADFYIFHRAQ
jgi:hypothetical protein